MFTTLPRYDVAMHDDDAPPALRQAFAAWLAGVTDEGAATRLKNRQDPLPPALARATRAQLAALGLAYDDEIPSFGRKYVGTGDLRADHAPGDAHAALSLALYGDDGALWWIDGRPLQLPAEAPPGLVLDSIGHWVDGHTFAIPVGGLDHPLADPRVNDALGDLRALLLHDAQQGRSRLELPAPDERWTDPVATRSGQRIAIRADRADVGRPPVRWLDAS